jgi:predicted hotdog family 3-hydroxylacyl-ACP dehydratase
MSAFPPIADLVPHGPPTLSVDELIGWSEGTAHTRLVVREGGLLVRDGVLDTVVTLELMAQTVAACLGYQAFQQGGGVRVGMVVACRKFAILRPRVLVGERLDIRVTRLRGTDDVSSFDAETHDGRGELVSKAVMTLVHGDKPPE